MMHRHRHDRLQEDLTSVEAAIAALPALDPLGRLSLETYRDELIAAVDDERVRPAHAARVEMSFGGGPAARGDGVDAAFLADTVGGVVTLINRVCGTRGGARLVVTGFSLQPAGAVLEELDEAGDLLFPSPLRRAVTAVIDHLNHLAHGSDDDFTDLVESTDPRVLTAARDVVGRICGRQGTLGVAQGEQQVRLDDSALDRAWRRLEATHIDEAPLRLTGRLLGIIPLGRRFEFQPDDGRPAIAGRVDERVSARYLAPLEHAPVAGHRCSALLERVTVERPGHAPMERYTLLELDPVPEG